MVVAGGNGRLSHWHCRDIASSLPCRICCFRRNVGMCSEHRAPTSVNWSRRCARPRTKDAETAGAVSSRLTMSSARSASLIRPAIIGAVLVKPSLWLTAVRQVALLAPRGWWKRAPFLPVPRTDYLEFRLVTQYGGNHGEPRDEIRPVDVVNYLQWCKEEHS